MIKSIEIFISLIFLFMGVLGIVNARYIAKKRLFMFDENKATNFMKILSYIICVTALVFIYLFR